MSHFSLCNLLNTGISAVKSLGGFVGAPEGFLAECRASFLTIIISTGSDIVLLKVDEDVAPLRLFLFQKVLSRTLDIVVLSASDSPSASALSSPRSPDSFLSMSSSLASISELLSARSLSLFFSLSFSALSSGSLDTW